MLSLKISQSPDLAADITFYGIKGQVLQTFTRPVVDPPEVLRVFRDEIGRQLIDEAQRLYPDAIQFHFKCPIAAVDLDMQTVTINSNAEQVSNNLKMKLLVSCTTDQPFCLLHTMLATLS